MIGRGQGFIGEAESFFNQTRKLRVIALWCFYFSIPNFLIGLGATSHILLPMSSVTTCMLIILYFTLIVCVFSSIFFVHHTAEKLRQETESHLDETERKLAEATTPAATPTSAITAITTTTTSMPASHARSNKLTASGERAPLLFAPPRSHMARVRLAAKERSSDLSRLNSTESIVGSDDFQSVADLEESTEAPT